MLRMTDSRGQSSCWLETYQQWSPNIKYLTRDRVLTGILNVEEWHTLGVSHPAVCYS